MKAPKMIKQLIATGSLVSAFALTPIAVVYGQTNTFPSSGNVGVGTTTPTNPLVVSGGANAYSSVVQNTAAAGTSFGLIVDAGGNSSDFAVRIRQRAGGNELFAVRGDGNVGIGTTSPSQKLQVNAGAIYVTQSAGSDYLMFDHPGINTWRTRITTDNTSSYVIGNDIGGTFNSKVLTLAQNGYVGIGTTSPANRFEVASGTADPFFFNGTYNKFKAASGWTYLESYHGAEIVIDNSGNYSDRTFTISKGASRIGGGTPTALLTVNENGNVNISGTINAKYQDVAEWVPSSEQLSAGTVVVLDSTKSNQVTSSSVSYDKRVAGVVSEQPGIALGEKSDTKVLVATTGRVRVKVDASKGAIHIGDLLVTSDIPAVAMKSEPVEFAGRKMHMPGTLIGKALEPLEKGKGTILVLLSLQ